MRSGLAPYLGGEPIFAATGLKKPDISILSDEFLAEVRGMPQRNLAVEMLRKLLAGEIKTRGRKNVVQARSFAELLENSITRYQNRAIETAQVIEEPVKLAKHMRENVRAQMRVIIKRILRKYGYPSDKQKKVTQTVLEQAEVLCQDWMER